MSQPINKIERKLKKQAKKAVAKAVVASVVAGKPKTSAVASLRNNPAGKIRGKGSYVSDFLSALGQTGAGITKGIGAVTGGLGSLLSGFGDYRERASKGKYIPMAIGDGAGGGPGTFVGAAAPRIRHREYIGNVFSTINFATTVYPIQIGVRSLFPWLSTMADSFQQYRIHGMELYYESTSSNVSATTNTALGSVMMSTLYEVIKPPLDSSVEILNSEFTTSEKPTECFYHPIECDPSKTTIANLYVRTAFQSQSSFTDLGNFQVSTEGMQADGVQIGKLWCTYDVELMKPTLPQPVNSYARWLGSFNATGNSSHISNSSPSVSLFPGVQPTITAATSIVAPAYTVNQLNMPKDLPGQYVLLMAINTVEATNLFSVAGIPALTGAVGITPGTAWFSDYWPHTGLTAESVMASYLQHDFGGITGIQPVGFQAAVFLNVPSTGGSIIIDLPFGSNNTNAGIAFVLVQVPPLGFAVEAGDAKQEVEKTSLASMLARLSLLDSAMHPPEEKSVPTFVPQRSVLTTEEPRRIPLVPHVVVRAGSTTPSALDCAYELVKRQ